jgi:ABC-type oligopeptide transport system substrate-binding subunit
VTGETLEMAAYLERMYGNPDMLLSGIGGGHPDPDMYLRVLLTLLTTGWKNDRYQGLVEKAKRVMDLDARMRLYQAADRALMEEAPIIPLTYMRTHLLVKPWVTRYRMSALGTWSWKDVVIEPH